MVFCGRAKGETPANPAAGKTSKADLIAALKASSEYWRTKIARNVARDRAADATLDGMGWTVVRVWDQDVNGDLGGCVRRVTDALIRRGWRPGSDREIQRQVGDVAQALAVEQDAEH